MKDIVLQTENLTKKYGNFTALDHGLCLARDNSYETLLSSGIVAILTIIIIVMITWLVFRKKEIK